MLHPWPDCGNALCTLHHLVVIKFYVHNAVRLDSLDNHTLEVNRQTPLELVRAQRQELDSLSEGNVGMMVLVENRKAVVSVSKLSVGAAEAAWLRPAATAASSPGAGAGARIGCTYWA